MLFRGMAAMPVLAAVLTMVTSFGFKPSNVRAAENVPIDQMFSATDSLGTVSDTIPDAEQCLDGLCWKPQTFTIECGHPERKLIDAIVRFPSAKPVGIPQNDTVNVEWYAAKTTDGQLCSAPAMIVVHESGSGMTVGRLVARGLRDRGIHAFMVQLPFYGSRRPRGIDVDDQDFGVVMEQAIADVRRARDAIAVLPGVDHDRIHLQGTSLGGFVAATTAGLDDAFHNVFILLAGGDLPKLVATGQRETAELKVLLEKQGFVGERMLSLLNRFEPNRLAHRISKDRLWLFTASFDTTVPPVHADSLARAAGLATDHHIRMPATHYSGVIFLPIVLDQIAEKSGGRTLVAQ